VTAPRTSTTGTARPNAVIAMWSPPRCRSTAFERMMTERGDLKVVHEPFNILASTGSYRLDGRVHTDETALFEAIAGLADRGPRPVFLKDTTDHRFPGLLADPRFATRIRHTFIIRDLAEVIASHYALRPGITAEHVGFGHCWEIFERVRGTTGVPPVVVDAADLVADPAGTAAAYSAALGLPHRPGAVRWAPGDRREWHVYADWHRDVATSAGIHHRSGEYTETVHNNPHLAGLHAANLPYYERLHAHRLTPLPARTPA
jgi:Sulfotransferase domain